MPREKKKKTLIVDEGGCSGFLCDWAMTRGSFQCVDGDGGCEGAIFCEAEESPFHPKELEEATKKINRILSAIPKDPEGRSLSFCHTHRGILLAWCQHTGKPRPKTATTRHDSPDKVEKALKLKPKK
jgi:hypothetical protein